MKTSPFLRVPLRPLRLCGLLLLLAATATAAPPKQVAGASRSSPLQGRLAPSPSSSFTTSPYGLGTRTTDSQGRTYTTTPYGNGTRTTGPGGSNYTTTRYGNGTITRGTGTPPPVIPAPPKKSSAKRLSRSVFREASSYLKLPRSVRTPHASKSRPIAMPTA